MIYLKDDRVNPKNSHNKEFFFLFCFYFLYEMMDADQAYCYNHLTTYLSKTVMADTLKLCSNVCQRYLNKRGKNNYYKNSFI